MATTGGAAFDEFAERYDAILNASLSASGETKEYFARGRMAMLARQLRSIDSNPATVLDFGCGTGSSLPLFFEVLGAQRVVGVDVSSKSLDIARKTCRDERVTLVLGDRFRPRGDIDLAFMNGVLHHIAPNGREDALRRVYQSLWPGGQCALFENNPWSLGARWCMYKNPFDRDAIFAYALDVRRLLRRVGFAIRCCRYLFVFPSCLRACRPLERYLERVPLGAQYFVLAQRERA